MVKSNELLVTVVIVSLITTIVVVVVTQVIKVSKEKKIKITRNKISKVYKSEIIFDDEVCYGNRNITYTLDITGDKKIMIVIDLQERL